MTDQDKRERIISAAYTVLSEKGYDLASTKEIARTAGVAQGLINYYFASKDLLFAEVFRRETDRYCSSFHTLMEIVPPLPQGVAPSLEMVRAVLKEPKQRALEQIEWYRLRYELIAIGLRDGAAIKTLQEMLDSKRSYISRNIMDLTGLPEDYAKPLSSILYSIFEGLGLQKITDSSFAYDEAFEMLAQMLTAFLGSLYQ